MADGPTYEEVIPGDFVRLEGDSKLGLVESMENGIAYVVWLGNLGHGSIDWRKLTPIRD